MTTNEPQAEGSIGYKHPADRTVQERIESITSLGSPCCDVCYGMHKDDRDEAREEGAEFWPSEVTIWVNVDARALVNWKAVELCPYHDTAENKPDGATHRVKATAEYIGDRPDEMNSAHRFSDVSVAEADA